MTAGLLVMFAGYTVGSYGLVLLRGWDIPFRRWVNPLNPWTWPAKGAKIPQIPATRVFASPPKKTTGP